MREATVCMKWTAKMQRIQFAFVLSLVVPFPLPICPCLSRTWRVLMRMWSQPNQWRLVTRAQFPVVPTCLRRLLKSNGVSDRNHPCQPISRLFITTLSTSANTATKCIRSFHRLADISVCIVWRWMRNKRQSWRGDEWCWPSVDEWSRVVT